MSIVLSTMQKEAVNKIKEWFTESLDQYFVLAGYAGTGKTTIVQAVIDELGLKDHEVVFSAFTGKASLVLRNKLKDSLRSITLHKLLYRPARERGRVIFVPRSKEEYKQLRLIVVDECSMVNQELLDDLMNTEVPILFVGDHGQLPPIGEPSWLYKQLTENPNATLTEIHRQAENNPIIYLSMLARQGKRIDFGTYNKKALVIPRSQVNTQFFRSLLNADQIICGYNKTRKRLNNQIRKALGYHGNTPQVGEKLICLRNNWGKKISSCALVNGMTGYVSNIVERKNYSLYRLNHWEISFRPDFENKESFEEIRIIPERFHGQYIKMVGSEWHDYDDFDFGYAITCHKGQGSEWDNVFVYNEVLDPATHSRWLYTALTRASNALILAQ